MPHKLNKKYSDSFLKLQSESQRSKYMIMISYLQYLYRRHPDLELEIITMLFLNKERSYHEFINGHLSAQLVEPLCNNLTMFLGNRGYPTSFIDYKSSCDNV